MSHIFLWLLRAELIFISLNSIFILIYSFWIAENKYTVFYVYVCVSYLFTYPKEFIVLLGKVYFTEMIKAIQFRNESCHYILQYLECVILLYISSKSVH